MLVDFVAKDTSRRCSWHPVKQLAKEVPAVQHLGDLPLRSSTASGISVVNRIEEFSFLGNRVVNPFTSVVQHTKAE